MRKRILSVLFGLTLFLATVAVAFAEEYVVTITVDGKPVALSIVVDGDSLEVDSESPGVEVASIVAAATATTSIQPPESTATANRDANLRGGPGTNHPVVGGVKKGQALTVIGSNPAGDWLQLSDNKWIAAFLVSGGPTPTATLPTTQPTATPTIVSPTATPIPTPTTGPRCDPSYPGICIPLNSPDLDCGEISDRRFQVLPPDPHNFDGDNDGIGCES